MFIVGATVPIMSSVAYGALEMLQIVSHNKGEQQLLVGTVSYVMWMYFLFALVQQVHSISS